MKTVTTIRARLGLTQAALAEKIGVVQSAVAQYEAGKIVIQPDRAKRLIEVARELGVELTMDQVYGLAPIEGEEPKAAA